MRASCGRENWDEIKGMSPVLRAAVTGNAGRKGSEEQPTRLRSSSGSDVNRLRRLKSQSNSKSTGKLHISSSWLNTLSNLSKMGYTKQLHRNFSNRSDPRDCSAPRFLNTLEMHMCTHKDGKKFLYGWLTEQEFSDLRTIEGEEVFAEWCASAMSPQVSRQNTENSSRDEEVGRAPEPLAVPLPVISCSGREFNGL
jgi:hypothetical protein